MTTWDLVFTTSSSIFMDEAFLAELGAYPELEVVDARRSSSIAVIAVRVTLRDNVSRPSEVFGDGISVPTGRSDPPFDVTTYSLSTEYPVTDGGATGQAAEDELGDIGLGADAGVHVPLPSPSSISPVLVVGIVAAALLLRRLL